MAEKIVRRPRDLQQDEHYPAGSDSVRLAAGPGEKPQRVIVEQADLTERMLPNPPSAVEDGQLEPIRNDRAVDSVTALQIGIARLVWSMHGRSINLDKLIGGGPVEVSDEWGIQRLYFDWPRQDDEIQTPSAAIVTPDEATYASRKLRPAGLLEDTADRWGDGTVLRETGETETMVHLVFFCTHKEERRAIRKWLEESMLVELNEGTPGRRIVIPEYWDRVARYEMLGVRPGDGAQGAQGNEWTLVARFTAQIGVVQLVQRPAYLDRPRIHVGVVDTLDE